MQNINVAKFLFEIGTLRKIARSHRQTLLTDDLSDNIASHSYRVAVIGMFLATIVNADTGKVVMMCLTHDWPETRSNDHNWVHKKNVRTDVMGIITQQFDLYEMPSIKAIIDEYEERKTHESIIAKDSDTIDQLLLLKEYELIGNKEATRWLQGKTNQRPYAWIDRMKLDSAKQLGKIIYDISPSDWWNGLYTSDNLSFS